MTKHPNRSLHWVVYRLLATRLFLPTLVLILSTLAVVAHVGSQNLRNQQLQLTGVMAVSIEDYVNRAIHSIETLSQNANYLSYEELDVALETTYRVSGYFDSLFRLDNRAIIRYHQPPDPQYTGMDLSNQPYLDQSADEITVSTYISHDSGMPVIPIARPLPDGGWIVGELNLENLQRISRGSGNQTDQALTFIMDQSGTLLAHTQSQLVAQRVNLRYLFLTQPAISEPVTFWHFPARLSLSNLPSLISATPVEPVGWIVAVQAPLNMSLEILTRPVLIVAVIYPLIWLLMLVNLHLRLKRQVIDPLSSFRQSIQALTEESPEVSTIPVKDLQAFRELNDLFQSYQQMLSTIQQKQEALKQSDLRYRSLFEDAPISLWEEDFSQVKFFLDSLLENGITDIREFFIDNPDQLEQCISLIAIADLNQASVQLANAKNKAQLFDTWISFMRRASSECLMEQFIAIANNQSHFEWEGITAYIDGIPQYLQVRWIVVPGYEKSYAKVIVSVVDITDLKTIQDQERDQRILAEALRDTAEALNSTLDLDTVLDRILLNAGKVVPHDASTLMLIEDGCVRIVRHFGYHERGLDDYVRAFRFPLNEIANLQQMADTGMPLAIPDTQQSPAWVKFPGMEWLCSFAGAPIHIKGKTLGFINIDSTTPGFFSQAHAHHLMAFAHQAAIAIENARLYARLQQMSITDELTSLYNRRGFLELGARDIERARRFDRPLTALFLDIDHFKMVNDNHGHTIGDQVLKEIASRIDMNLRTIDLSSRFGGEEFAILLPETEISEASLVAERLRQSIAAKPVTTEKVRLNITMSVGVATLTHDIADLVALVDKADRAMYLAKQSGRNRVYSI